MELPNIFKGDYRLLAIAPIILIVISLIFIPQIKFGVDFTGGTLITLNLPAKIDGEKLKVDLEAEGLKADVKIFDTAVGYKAEIEVPQSSNLVKADKLKQQFNNMITEVSQLEVLANQNSSNLANYTAKKAQLDNISNQLFAIAGTPPAQTNTSDVTSTQKSFAAAYKKVYDDYQESISVPINKHVKYSSISVQTVSPLLQERFVETAIKVVGLSAVLSIIFVFLFFRKLVPSIAVLTGAASDIIIALGAMAVFGIPFTLASFAALLMLIGFSLDTDILLTMRMLKRKGDPREKAHDAMKTGLTMSMAAIVAFGVLFILGVVTHIPTYYEISAVALAGLVADMFATWGINAVLLLWDSERQKGVAA